MVVVAAVEEERGASLESTDSSEAEQGSTDSSEAESRVLSPSEDEWEDFSKVSKVQSSLQYYISKVLEAGRGMRLRLVDSNPNRFTD